jgi:hypothetical protein
MPGPFSMADPRRLSDELAEAGFTQVSVTEFAVPFRLDSAQEYAAFNRAVSPPMLLRRIRDRFGSEDDPGTWRAVADAAERYRSDGAGPPDGIALPSTALCLRAIAPLA